MKVRHVDLHPDEFLAAVAGEMEPAELGVYWMICLLIYSRGEAIKHDVEWLQAKFAKRTDLRVIKNALARLLASERVELSGGYLVVKRCVSELQVAANRIATAEENGRKGGRPRKENKDLGKPEPFSDEKLTTNHQPPTSRDDVPTSSQTKGRADGRSTRGFRLPADWQPSDADRRFAIDECGLDPDRVLPEFRDFWIAQPGAKGVKLDWSATWRNRCRQLADNPRGSALERPGPRRSQSSGVVAALGSFRLAGEGD